MARSWVRDRHPPLPLLPVSPRLSKHGKPIGRPRKAPLVIIGAEPQEPLVALERTGTLRVVLVRRGGFGSEAEERPVAWPEGWSLPRSGDRVVLAPEFGGQVQFIQFMLAEGIIQIVLG
jgi:hypothetical protein